MGRTTETRLPTWRARFWYSSLERREASVGSATTVPEASMPRICGKDLMGYRPFLRCAGVSELEARTNTTGTLCIPVVSVDEVYASIRDL